jgi:hypothetical protein
MKWQAPEEVSADQDGDAGSVWSAEVSAWSSGVSGDRESDNHCGEKNEEEFAGDVHARFLEASFAAGPEDTAT